ncbi:MAG: dihydropteroate synthase [Bacteroidota bacterium]|nr:dihydropteroate synthase [Bacteroidota bacterium]
MNQKEYSFTLNINGRLMELNTPKVMGILNVTPDSFFSSSRYMSEEGILRRTETMIDEGVDIIDVGACSTRPGIDLVSESEEFLRIRMALHLIRKRWPDFPISVDTFRSRIADMAVSDFEANIINDISGGEMDPAMFSTMAKLKVPYILMHMQGTPADMQKSPHYDNMMKEIFLYFSEKIRQLREVGVNDIILDPGYGFGKTLDNNYELLRRLPDFQIFELPLLVGVSRKSMIFKLLNTTPEQALNGTTILNTLALNGGANILRVHDVKEARECVQLMQIYKTAGICQSCQTSLM